MSSPNDFNVHIDAPAQYAQGSITYGDPTEGVRATGQVTIVDYLKAKLTAATQTLTLSGAITPGSHAVGTLTSTGVTPIDGETVTIGSTVYRFKTVMAQAYDVQQDVDAAVSLDNLKAAINASGTPGVEYFAGTLVHPTVIATTNTDTTQVVQARTPGTAGNAIVTDDDSALLSWGGATLAGGVAGETVTIDGRVYTFIDALTETSGAAAIVDQVLHGGTTAIALDNLKLALNAGAGAGTNYSTGTTAHATTNATTNTDTTQVIAADTSGAAGNSIAVSEALANGSWGAATLAGGYDNLTVTVNGTALVQGSDWNAGASNNAAATALASAINALANIGASANSAVVTITADEANTTANGYALVTSSAPAATVSGATLSGGVNPDTVTVNSQTYKCVSPATDPDEFANIAGLTALIEADADLTATSDGTTITIKASATGVAGNSIDLAVGGSNAGTLAVSGATLSGGTDGDYSSVIDLGGDYTGLDVVVTITALSGTAPTLTVTPYVSLDGTNWVARTATAALNATGSTELSVTNPLRYLKFLYDIGGTENPTATGVIRGVPNAV